MKVVLFCGGLGTRLREHSDTVPKSLVNVGVRPIIWHLMRYYAYYGHKDFILCLGYRGDMIKKYFMHYDECLSNDFVLSKGGREVKPLHTDIQDWTITFVETGLHSNIGQRLSKVRQFVEQDDMFMANYSDGLSDLPLDVYLKQFRDRNAVASLAAMHSSQSFHAVTAMDDGTVSSIGPVQSTAGYAINGGFFIMRPEIFDYIKPGEELVEQPFQRLIEEKKLYSYRHDGFWSCMDTFKDKITFDRRYARGDAPWEVWNHGKNAK